MTSVPDRARVRLTGISSRAYEHPADRSALVALRKLTGFDSLLRKLFGLFNERAFRLTYLAGAVKVSERQFPHIHELVRDGSYILDLPEVPEVFVVQSPLVNAMALGRDKPFIVITTGMVNLYDPEELRWVVGHELGHILSGHTVYRTMLLWLIGLAARIAWTPIAFGIQAIVWGLEERARTAAHHAALELGANVLEGARAEPWGKLDKVWADAQQVPSDMDAVLPDAKLAVTVAPEPKLPGCRRVTVEVRWQFAPQPAKSVQMTTLLSRREAKKAGGTP